MSTKDESNYTEQANEALYVAVEEGSLEKLNEAAAGGADVNFLSHKRLPGWSEDYRGSGTGNSVLHLACWLGLDRSIINRLLDLGSDIHLKSLDDGYSPIHTAIKSGNAELVAHLLGKGCNPNAKDNFGFTPLMWKSCLDFKAVAELLLDRGADISDRNSDGNTSLVFACEGGHKEVVELLLDRGADITNENGETCLMLASEGGHEKVVGLLLDRGAEPCSKWVDEFIYLNEERSMRLSYHKKKEVVELLLNRPAFKWTKAFYTAAMEGDLEKLDEAVANGANTKYLMKIRRTDNNDDMIDKLFRGKLASLHFIHLIHIISSPNISINLILYKFIDYYLCRSSV
jgi:hypothetical protein